MKVKMIDGIPCLVSLFDSQAEEEYYCALKEYLQDSGVWEFVRPELLVRYVKMHFMWFKLATQSKKHYMLDKYASHLAQLEEDLLLNPKSMLEYQKSKTLMLAKQQKMKNTI